ncbi:hypothetical protein SBRCBS47491_007357 [Sporothrix bragantina]|uniref:Clock-controlled pheromone ccg-4 n=1 Tax=Sporothrix bragantina TaxID=671064 RepID=A0ABP0CCK5_9PEZI
MKTAAIFTILAIGATSASAAAIADAEAQFCMWKGQSCWKAKRTAEAFAEAIASVGGPAADADSAVFRRSHADGGVANNALRSLDGLANIVASTQSNPRSFYSDLYLATHFPAPAPASDAEKRDAEANPEAEAQFCMWKGQSCWKVKRAAEAIVNTIDGFTSVAKREASPEAEAQFCMWKGQSCWKRSEDNLADRCYAPDGSCAAATRDLNAMYNAARQVLDSLPSQ